MLAHRLAILFHLIASVLCVFAISSCTVIYASEAYWAEYESIYKTIKATKEFPAATQTEPVYLSHQPADATTFHYVIVPPENYSEKTSWPLIFFLHGGVKNSLSKISDRVVERFEKYKFPGFIYVYPSAWSAKTWWDSGQSENITEILNTVKREYNIDSNRVYMQGVSDGGSGAFYFASHLPTAFAGFVPMIGSVRVLSPANNTFGTTYLTNFTNKPLYVVNTVRDSMYPAKQQRKKMKTIQELGGDLTFRELSGKHNLEWYEDERDKIQNFLGNTIRNPYPDHLQWQVDKDTPFQRIHWLIAGRPIDPDKNSAIEVHKRDNDIFVAPINMDTCNLLLSTEHLDFSKNIRIWVNRTLVYDDLVIPDVATLKKWHAIDQDRNMLFAKEIKLVLSEPE